MIPPNSELGVVRTPEKEACAILSFASLHLCAVLLCSCSDTYRSAYNAPFRHSSSASRSVARQLQPPSWWKIDETTYRDRNHDGRIDWEVTGDNWGTDGFGIYKEDTDYDGIYDRTYDAGGFSYNTRWSREIHEPVPIMGRFFVPIRPLWTE